LSTLVEGVAQGRSVRQRDYQRTVRIIGTIAAALMGDKQKNSAVIGRHNPPDELESSII
jgi:hypothetical protein